MKKQIIIISTAFLSLLLVMIIFVAISSTTKPEDFVLNSTDSLNVIERPLAYEADSISFRFPATEYKNIARILENADLQAMRFEMYHLDSIGKIELGVINKYKFTYRYTIKYHFIIICDTVSGKKYYSLKSGKFVDDLILH